MIFAHFRPREEKNSLKKYIILLIVNQRFRNIGSYTFIVAEFDPSSRLIDNYADAMLVISD